MQRGMCIRCQSNLAFLSNADMMIDGPSAVENKTNCMSNILNKKEGANDTFQEEHPPSLVLLRFHGQRRQQIHH